MRWWPKYASSRWQFSARIAPTEALLKILHTWYRELVKLEEQFLIYESIVTVHGLAASRHLSHDDTHDFTKFGVVKFFFVFIFFSINTMILYLAHWSILGSKVLNENNRFASHLYDMARPIFRRALTWYAHSKRSYSIHHASLSYMLQHILENTIADVRLSPPHSRAIFDICISFRFWKIPNILWCRIFDKK